MFCELAMAWFWPQGVFAVCLLKKEGHPFAIGLSLVQCSKNTSGIGIRLANSFVCDHQCAVSNTWKREKEKKTTTNKKDARSQITLQGRLNSLSRLDSLAMQVMADVPQSTTFGNWCNILVNFYCKLLNIFYVHFFSFIHLLINLFINRFLNIYLITICTHCICSFSSYITL